MAICCDWLLFAGSCGIKKSLFCGHASRFSRLIIIDTKDWVEHQIVPFGYGNFARTSHVLSLWLATVNLNFYYFTDAGTRICIGKNVWKTWHYLFSSHHSSKSIEYKLANIILYPLNSAMLVEWKGHLQDFMSEWSHGLNNPFPPHHHKIQVYASPSYSCNLKLKLQKTRYLDNFFKNTDKKLCYLKSFLLVPWKAM